MIQWIKEKYTNLHIGKDTYTILILVGILLFVISWPVNEKKTDTEIGKSEKKSETELEGADKVEESGSWEKESDAVPVMSVGNGAIYDDTTEIYVKNLEQRLEQTLSMVEGVGKVKVMVTLQATSERIIEKDQPMDRSIVTETDGEGGNRNSNDMSSEETTVYITDGEGNQIPYVVKELEPVVEGVTVVAQGGGNPVINKNISDIIQALFGIQPHKIIVVKMKS